MNKTVKFLFIFIGSGALMFLIFYFYPAHIFDVELIGSQASHTEEIHLKGFLGLDQRHEEYLNMYGYEQKNKLSGWLILFIMLCGLPAMLAYRSLISKNEQQQGSNDSE